MKKTIVFDFDGVIHSYESGWKGIENIPDPPVPGIKEAITKLRRNGYEVVVVSTRCGTDAGREAIKRYFNKYEIFVDGVCKEKPPAVVYVDDRAVRFDGNVDKMIYEIINFESWIEKKKRKDAMNTMSWNKIEPDDEGLYTGNLPDEGEEVLFCAKNGEIFIDELCCDGFYDDGNRMAYIGNGYDLGDIAAWMPLPKPYKENE